MALNYEVKKRVFGFDETKTEKYVAQMKTLGVVGFKDLCDEVSKIGMAPRGVVKLVLDGLIDTLNMDINKGFSVQLGEFGCFLSRHQCQEPGQAGRCEGKHDLSPQDYLHPGLLL